MLCKKSFPFNCLHRSHLLQVLDDGHVGIHVAVDAVLHAGLLRSVESSGGDLAGDALAEAGIRQAVHDPLDLRLLVLALDELVQLLLLLRRHVLQLLHRLGANACGVHDGLFYGAIRMRCDVMFAVVVDGYV